MERQQTEAKSWIFDLCSYEKGLLLCYTLGVFDWRGLGPVIILKGKQSLQFSFRLFQEDRTKKDALRFKDLPGWEIPQRSNCCSDHRKSRLTFTSCYSCTLKMNWTRWASYLKDGSQISPPPRTPAYWCRPLGPPSWPGGTASSSSWTSAPPRELW